MDVDGSAKRRGPACAGVGRYGTKRRRKGMWGKVDARVVDEERVLWGSGIYDPGYGRRTDASRLQIRGERKEEAAAAAAGRGGMTEEDEETEEKEEKERETQRELVML